MFFHQHPYEPFIPKGTSKLIIGTLPPPRFSQNMLVDYDVDFCYGSKNGLLWPILDRIFNLKLDYKTTNNAIVQRKAFLRKNNIGICDIVESCKRKKIDASDLGMQQVKIRNIIHYLKKHPSIKTILFMGGNSKNGPEYFFRKLLNQHELKLKIISNGTPRKYQFKLDKRIIETISLTAPSGAANRAIGGLDSYKKIKQLNSNFNTFDFRVLQYKQFFNND